MHDGSLTALVGSVQKFSVEDGPGIRTTVFLKGCPLRCRWCHNPELIDPAQQLIQSPNNCIGCGACVQACPVGAIAAPLPASRGQADRGAGDGDAPREGDPRPTVRIDRDACTVCLACARACYARALRPVAREMSADDVLRQVAQDRGFYDRTGGGLTISGGEVLSHGDFATALVDGAAELGIRSCLDTCGMGDPDLLMGLALRESVTDVLYDMKAVDDGVHRACTGVGNARILANLRMLASDERTRGKVTMRMPLVRGLNDGDDLIGRAADLYRELGLRRVTLLPYHDLGVGKKRNLGGTQERFEPPDEGRLARIGATLRDRAGMEVEVLGRL